MGEAGPTIWPKPPRRLRRRWLAAAAALLAVVVFIGPWPYWQSHYENTDYAAATFVRISRLNLSSSPAPLKAGVSVADITPRPGEPLAGFSVRRPKENDGVIDRLHVKAISLSTGGRTFTIVAADILLVLPDLRDAVLERVHLPADEVFFTATHTHSGPGGYSPRPIDRIVLGSFDAGIRDRLADSFARVIQQSRSQMVDASVTWGASPGDPNQPTVTNRLSPDYPAHATVFAMGLRSRNAKSGPPTLLATLASASAHPTCLKAWNRQACADYPGVVEQMIELKSGGPCLFAAAAVGSMTVAEANLAPMDRRQTIGRRIADLACEMTGPGAHWADQAILAGEILRVTLPPAQYRLGDSFQVSRIAAWFLHARTTYVQVLRLGNVVLLGMPCDYSGELAQDIEYWARPHGLLPVITSFNGDYIGYLLPRARYDGGSYEVRDMSFFGPSCGEYFQDISRRIIGGIDNHAQGVSGERPE